MFGREVTDHAKETASAMLDRGIPALNRLTTISTYMYGETLSAADVFSLHAFKLANNATKVIFKRDIVAEIPGLAEMMSLLEERDDTKKVLDDNRAALKAMQAAK